jgi:cytoskeletal protein CcmA (bactofilin family)
MFFNKKKKSGNSQRQAAAVAADPSFIGRNCVFEGHITCDGELHIDGTVRGTVQANLCVIDAAGVVQGSVAGGVIHVRGRVLGPIQGSNVFIHAGAHVEGDVFNDTISIENGAYVFGSIRHNATAARAAGQQPKPNGLLKPQTQLPDDMLDDAQPRSNNLRIIANGKP